MNHALLLGLAVEVSVLDCRGGHLNWKRLRIA